jgi:hypothetical protein
MSLFEEGFHHARVARELLSKKKRFVKGMRLSYPVVKSEECVSGLTYNERYCY